MPRPDRRGASEPARPGRVIAVDGAIAGGARIRTAIVLAQLLSPRPRVLLDLSNEMDDWLATASIRGHHVGRLPDLLAYAHWNPLTVERIAAFGVRCRAGLLIHGRIVGIRGLPAVRLLRRVLDQLATENCLTMVLLGRQTPSDVARLVYARADALVVEFGDTLPAVQEATRICDSLVNDGRSQLIADSAMVLTSTGMPLRTLIDLAADLHMRYGAQVVAVPSDGRWRPLDVVRLHGRSARAVAYRALAEVCRARLASPKPCPSPHC